jgi:hypothetical protein
MHGCSGHIECISAWVREVGFISDAFVKCLDDPIHVSAVPLYDEIVVRCSVVCTSNLSSYLNVSTDVLWLTPDMLGEEFEIYSNVDWKID